MQPAACIVVAPVALELLEQRLRGLPVDFAVAIMTDFSGCDDVPESYQELMGRWDKARTTLTESLGQLAGVVGAVREAFVLADATMAGGLVQAPATF